MKYLLLSLGFLASTAYAADDLEVAGGTAGKVLAECSGQTNEGIEVVTRVQPVLGHGLTLRVIENAQTIVWDRVEKDATDPRGLIYAGHNARLLVPAMQRPGSAPGEYKAFLSLKGETGSIILACKRN